MAATNDPERRRLTRTTDPRVVLAVLALVGMNASFMQTLVIPIQAHLPELLDAEKDDTSWVVTVTLLASAVITPIAGRLGDLFGKRRILLILLGVLVAGSIIAAITDSLGGLILGRALQGAAMGAVPLGISILRDVFPPARLSSAVALVSATVGIGGSLGLPLAAIVAENFEWHIMFWMSAALAALALLLSALVVPVSVLRSPGRFDGIGAAGLAIGLVGVLLALTKGASWGWLSPPTLVSGILGVAVLVLWVLYELRHESPLVDLRVAVRPAVLFTNLASIGVGFALFAYNVAVPQLLEAPGGGSGGFGLTLIGASLVILPSGLVMFLGSPVVGRIERRTGARPLLITGIALVAAAYVVMILSTEVWHFLVASIVIGFGIAFSFAVLPTLIMGAVPATETAAANGLNALMRSLGTTAAAAVVGAVLAGSVTMVGDTPLPSAGGFQTSFLIGGIAALVALVPAFFIPRRRARYDANPALPDGA